MSFYDEIVEFIQEADKPVDYVVVNPGLVDELRDVRERGFWSQSVYGVELRFSDRVDGAKFFHDDR